MQHTSVNVGTININTITNTTKLAALRTFIRSTDLDIIFLQEVENEQISLPGFNVICNVDHMRRGTAIALKEHIRYSHVEKSLDGRLLALRVHNTTLCNVYAPSGSVHRAERERFFNHTIAYYLRHRTDHIVLGGDFNCVLRPCDATGNNPSPALRNTVQQLQLHDVWQQLHPRETGYTYITHNSSSRLDRFYVSNGLREQLRTAHVHVCCFSDHKALTTRMCLPLPDRARGNGYWCLRPHLLTDENIEEFQIRWQYWTRQRRNFRSWMEWWLAVAKPKAKSFFRWKSKIAFDDFNREQQRLYEMLQRAYDGYQNNRDMITTINRIKAQMLQHQRRFSEMFMRINETFVAGEPLSTFQLGERTRRRTTIEQLRNERDEVINDDDAIRDHMVQYFTNLYAREDVEEEADPFRCERIIPEEDAVNETCMDDITTAEILFAIRTSASKKSPGPDGLPKEFYLRTFDVIHRELNLLMNEAIRSNIPSEFVHGVVVLVKKRGAGDSARSYRPISLINYDYKILSRILKLRLDNVMRAHSVLTRSQKCSNTGRNIFQATLAVKDRVAQLKGNHRKGKLVAFDLEHAFDRVDHHFLFNTMRDLGFNTALIDLLSRIAAASSSRLLINGRLSAPFAIERSVRQGDPLSMHLFVLYLHPLLRKLEQVCGDDLVVAYADDISAIVTSVDKLNAMRDLFRRFGRVAGARLNEAKTTAIDVGDTNQPLTVPWLRTENSIKILGVIFCNSVREMVALNWDNLATNFSRLVWMHSLRTLSLHQKVTLLNVFLTSKIWYVAAQLPPTPAHVAKLTATMRRYLFHGLSATIPMQQLARSREAGGLKLHLPGMKCTAILINRHIHEIDSLPYYKSFLQREIPPRANSIPTDLPCLKLLLSNIPNLPFQIRQHPSADLIHRFFIDRTEKPKVEIEYPATNWTRVWNNISNRCLLSHQRSELYIWVNQKVPHRKLLHRMRRVDGEQCTNCGEQVETIQHKFFDCPRVRAANDVLRRKLMLLTGGERFLQTNDLLRPALERIASPTRTLILRILAVYITYIINSNDRINVDELAFNFEVEV